MRQALTGFAALAVAMAGALVPATAWAHPSDLGTLTLDLLLDRGGLVAIDAAAPRATDAERPSPEARRQLAGAVLAALGVSDESADLDPTNSLLYHEVGFAVWLHTAYANTAVPGELRLDTRALQDVAAARSGRLLLDVCRVAFPDQRLLVSATAAAALPSGSGAGSADWDRRECAAWSLGHDDAPVTISARVEPGAPRAAPRTLQLPCGPPVDLDPFSTPVLASVALLGAERLHARATGDEEPASGLVAETFTFLRESAPITLSVPRPWRGRLRIGTREQRATRRVTARCPDLADAHAWRTSVVTFGVDEPACVPVEVTVDRNTRTMRVGVGTRCASPRSEARGR